MIINVQLQLLHFFAFRIQDPAYFPSDEKLMRFYKGLQKEMLGGMKFNDQNELKNLIDDIMNKDEYSHIWSDEDLLHFQEYRDKTEDQPEQEFRLVYQSRHMAQMLSLYGQDACCIDATYKTTRVKAKIFERFC